MVDSIKPYSPGIDPYERDPYERTDYYNAVTITWGELREGGYIDWNTPEFSWDYYDEDQRNRLQKLIDGRFWLREISMIPPGAWRISFIQTLNEAMSAAKLMYKALDDSHGALIESDEYHKSRGIDSDFPATLLNGSSGDYASNGRDYEYETIREGRMTEAMNDLQYFRHPDVYVLDKLEGCFSQLVSVNINGF